MKTLLFKPFEKYSETRLLLIGSAGLLAGMALAFLLNTRFNGAIDVHYGTNVTIRQVVIDNLVAVASIIVFLFIAGRIVNPKTRLVDIVSTALIARIPLYLAALLNIGDLSTAAGLEVERLVLDPNAVISAAAVTILVCCIIVVILLVAWFVALLYNGYKVSVNAKGTKAILLFIGALLLAEAVSVTVLYIIN